MNSLISENEALEKGLKEKSAESSQWELSEMDGQANRPSKRVRKSQWSRAGMRRHRQESPRGRECGRRLSQFVEKGSEIYAKT
jgi:hypothetical protein